MQKKIYSFSSRESDARELEERLSSNLKEEANALRRLEQQVELIRRDLAGITCCRCHNPLNVHDQFSQEVRKHLLRRGGSKDDDDLWKRGRSRGERVEQQVDKKRGGILKKNTTSPLGRSVATTIPHTYTVQVHTSTALSLLCRYLVVCAGGSEVWPPPLRRDPSSVTPTPPPPLHLSSNWRVSPGGGGGGGGGGVDGDGLLPMSSVRGGDFSSAAASSAVTSSSTPTPTRGRPRRAQRATVAEDGVDAEEEEEELYGERGERNGSLMRERRNRVGRDQVWV